MARLVSESISPSEIQAGDDITFDYINSKENIPSRVGSVINPFDSERGGEKHVLLWDYSLHSGPGFRMYKHEFIRNLGRIQVDENWPLSRLARYKQAIVNFGRLFVGISRQSDDR